MRISRKTLLFVALLLLAFSFLRDKPTHTDEIDLSLDEIVPPIELGDIQTNSIDFSACDESAGFAIESDLSKSSLDVVDRDDQYCYVETVYNIDDGYFTNECQVPLETGLIEFTGDNFQEISAFCSLKSAGQEILDLN